MSDFYSDSFVHAKAVWIKNRRPAVNYQAGFRCDFEGDSSKKYSLKISGASYYKVYLNGEFVCYGPARAPEGYVRTDEVTLFVKNGINKLAVEVAGYNCASYYTMPVKPFLTAEIYENNQPYKYTGKDFKGLGLDGLRVQKSHRYDTQRAFGEIWTFDNNDEIYNWKTSDNLSCMALYSFDITEKYIPRSVEYPKYEISGYEKIDEKGHIEHINIEDDKEAWEKIEVTGRFLRRISCECDGYHWDELSRNVIKELYGNFIPEEFNETSSAILNADEYVIYKMPCVNSGFLQNKIKVSEDAEVFVFFAEYNSGNGMVFKKFSGPINIVSYSLKKSDEIYDLESFEPYSCQYIGVALTRGKAEIFPPEIRELSYPDYENAKFSSEDEKLNRIFKAAANTFRQNTVDVYMDCPGRERAGWLCDTYFTSESERFFAGASKVERVHLENYTMAEDFPYMPQGMIPMLYPGYSRKGTYIPQWAMWYVVELYEYATRRDVVDLSKYKNLVYDLLSWFEQYENQDGLLEKLPGLNFIEWSAANDWVMDVNYPTNMLYSTMLFYVSLMFSDENAGEKSKRIRNKITEDSFDGRFFHDRAVRNEKGELVRTDDISETCQYYAYFFGFADESEKYEELTDLLKNICGPDNCDEEFKKRVAPSNAFIGNYLRLIILLRMKEFKKAVSDVKGYFSEMAEITGTLWEHNDIERGSLNHGFASFAGIVICYGLAGITTINYKEKKIYMDKEYLSGIGYSFVLKTEEGEINIKEKDGKKEINLPSGWISI